MIRATSMTSPYCVQYTIPMYCAISFTYCTVCSCLYTSLLQYSMITWWAQSYAMPIIAGLYTQLKHQQNYILIGIDLWPLIGPKFNLTEHSNVVQKLGWLNWWVISSYIFCIYHVLTEVVIPPTCQLESRHYQLATKEKKCVISQNWTKIMWVTILFCNCHVAR